MVRERNSCSVKEQSTSGGLRKRKRKSEPNGEKERNKRDYKKDRSRRQATERFDKDKDCDKEGSHKRRRIVSGRSTHAECSEKVEERKKRVSKGLQIKENASLSGKGTIKKSGGKENVLRPKNSFGDVDVKKNETYYRSNLRTAIKEINGIRFKDVHLNAIKKTPFWFLFEAIYIRRYEKLMQQCHKYEDDIRKILRTFDLDTGCFVIGGDYLELTSMDARLIFGISGGDRLIALKPEGASTPNWVKRCFRKELKNRKLQFQLYKPHILDKIRAAVVSRAEISIDDTARLVHCYFLAAFLTPYQNGSISSGLTEYAEDLTKICSYDWSSFIVEMLKSQLRSSVKMKAGGCANLLPYWLCEHTKLVEPLGEFFPRFLKWDMTELHDEIDSIKLSYVGNVTKFIRASKIIEEEKFSTLEEFRAPAVIGERLLERFVEENSNNIRTYYEGSDDEMVEPTADVAAFAENWVSEHPSLVKIVEGGDGLEPTSGMEDGLKATADVAYSGEELVADDPNLVNLAEADEDNRTPLQGFEDHAADSATCAEQLVADDPIMVKNDERAEENHTHLRGFEEQKLGTKDGLDFSTSQFFPMNYSPEYIPDQHVKNVISSVIDDVSFENRRGRDQVEVQTSSEGNVLGDGVVMPNVEKSLETEDSVVVFMTAELERLSAEMENNRTRFEKELKGRDEIIIQLKKENNEMAKELEKLSSEFEDKRVTFEVDLKNRDERISTLNDEKIELAQKLEEMSVPSATQVYDNPNNLAYLDALENIAILRKENEMLKDGKDQLSKAALVDSSNVVVYTPVEKGKGIAKYPDPSTLIKGVKARTDKHERKRIEFSPQLPTNELVRIHESVVDVDSFDFEGDGDASQDMHTYKFDYSCPAMKKSDEDVIKLVKELLHAKGKSHYVWLGEEPLALVTVENILKTLHHDRIDSNVIDAWAGMLHAKNLDLIPSCKYTTVFSASCWGLINGGRARNATTFDTLVDKRIEESIDKDVLLFPILAEGQGRGLGDHWTLLSLNIRKSVWKFYNSMRPRDNRMVDQHLKQSLIVVKHVDRKLHEIYKRLRPTNSFLKRKMVHPKSEACLQQVPNSVDCGVIVCQLIEKLMTDKRPSTGTFSINSSGNYRAYMVKHFVITSGNCVSAD